MEKLMLNNAKTNEETEAVAERRHGPKLSGFLESLARLRSTAVAAVADFYKQIYDGEKDAAVAEDWKHSGYATFEAVLRQNNVCDLGCYAAFKVALVEFGFDQIRRLGVTQLATLLGVPNDVPSLKDPDKMARAAALDEVSVSRERSGTPASPRQVQAIAQKHFVRPRLVEAPKPIRDEVIAALEAEVARLKKENAKLSKALGVSQQRLVREVKRQKKGRGRSRVKK